VAQFGELPTPNLSDSTNGKATKDDLKNLKKFKDTTKSQIKTLDQLYFKFIVGCWSFRDRLTLATFGHLFPLRRASAGKHVTAPRRRSVPFL
jgi:hypothetical protein